ncbi:DUF2213 domain-containing protein [Parapusillimonas sp. JC17]|uniref:DUF2213 domain-containing protein n=1 Tax=Parapusillimonas sp. JC17 TaxID=3445768 RepID=UPI003FA15BBA
MTIKITDSVALGDSTITDAGYLEAAARTARTGVQQYLGAELGRPDLGVVNVYRDEAEVFAKRSLDTFSKLPITNDHPATEVNASNWRDLAVGTTGDEVLRDGEYLKIGLKITDADAVQAVRDGKRELSVGYAAEIVWQDGVATDGTPYQAVQRNIVANHIAIVARGRAGHQARIGDSWGAAPVQDFQPGPAPKPAEGGHMTDQLKTVVLGDKAVQVAVTDVAAIEQFKTDAAKALADANTAHAAAIAAKDEQIGKLKADLQTAQDAAKIDVDKLVADRAALVEAVKAIDAKIDVAGKSDADLRKAAVSAKLGDEMVKDASEAEITGMFKAIAKDAKPANPVADAISRGIQSTDTNVVNDAQAGYVARLNRQSKKEG